MKISELELQYIIELKHIYTADDAKTIFSLVAEHFLKISRPELMLAKNKEIATADIEELVTALADLKAGKPIQYVLNEAHFYGLIFQVDENVLIPRPETEELVEWVLAEINNNKFKSLLDIGTGSGCIPITIKKQQPDVEVSAIDVSAGALNIARENAFMLQTKVNFIEASILDYSSTIKYDVIVSNPPYIRALEKEDMEDNVLNYEPGLALFVSDDDPLIFYRTIADFALSNLNKNGKLFFEINEFLAQENIDMLKSKNFKNIELRKDMQGKDRMICAMNGDETV